MFEQYGRTKKSLVAFHNVSVLISQLKSQSFKRPPGHVNKISFARYIMVHGRTEGIANRNTGYTVT